MAVTDTMLQPDLVILFSSSTQSLDKAEIRENAQQAEEEYTRLISLLQRSGLKAVGKRGEKHGDILILVRCSKLKLNRLARQERERNFMYGLPVSNLTSISDGDVDLTPADRIRLTHSYITSTVKDGGLAIVPESKEWTRVKSISAIHDPDFDSKWIRRWGLHIVGSKHLDDIKNQYGEAVGLYFCFLSTYTCSLTFISAVGIIFRYFGSPYSPLYSAFLILWATTFIEYWRICERKISVRWGSRGSFRVEKLRHDYNSDDYNGPWWLNDLKRYYRSAASIPIIFAFVFILAVILSALFVFEAFVTCLYSGPGEQFISYLPSLLFSLCVPRFLSFYHKYALRLTNWENHQHMSTHESSFTIKRFVLSGIVSYLGLALTAFVYVPFGQQAIERVHDFLDRVDHMFSATTKNRHMWAWGTDSRKFLDPQRLQDQMAAYTVTDQILNDFTEIGLPYIQRALSSFREGKFKIGSGGNGSKFRFKIESSGSDSVSDENDRSTTDVEREFLVRVRKEIALGEGYDVFEDYDEMVTQFGYVVIWSGVWNWAPAMALLNNVIEMWSDAFKITKHVQRPIPIRTDTIGPWLECMRALIWVSALVNAALVYLFSPTSPSVLESEKKVILLWIVLVLLAASHGFMIVQVAVRYFIERIFWRGSKEEKESENVEKEVKNVCLKTLSHDVLNSDIGAIIEENGEVDDFWKLDEGLQEMRNGLKES